MSIAKALANARARAQADAREDRPPELGDPVEVTIAGIVVRGVFAFEEDGWVYWADERGWIHATKR